MPNRGLMVRVRVNSTCLGKITLDSGGWGLSCLWHYNPQSRLVLKSNK